MGATGGWWWGGRGRLVELLVDPQVVGDGAVLYAASQIYIYAKVNNNVAQR